MQFPSYKRSNVKIIDVFFQEAIIVFYTILPFCPSRKHNEVIRLSFLKIWLEIYVLFPFCIVY